MTFAYRLWGALLWGRWREQNHITGPLLRISSKKRSEQQTYCSKARALAGFAHCLRKQTSLRLSINCRQVRYHFCFSRRAICFTGAGLSTAAGLGDYRGKRGKWTLEGQGDVFPTNHVGLEEMGISPLLVPEMSK